MSLPRAPPMLRLTLHLVLAATFAAGPAPKDKSTSGCRDPDTLYEEGLRDYNQNFTKAAIEKFEEAHRCSENPLILYNIGLAYRRLYDNERHKELLEKARAALGAYVAAIEKDPSLGADPEEVRPVLTEIDAELERLKPPEPEPGPEPEPPPQVEVPEDPGKPRRLLGIGLMSGGGALTVVGVAVGAALASRSARLHDELNGDGGVYDRLAAGGCGVMPGQDVTGADVATCDGLRGEREALLDEGPRANRIGFGMIAVAAVGLGLVAGGAVAFIQGKRATEAWESSRRARVRVVPTFTGLVLQGRF